MIIPNLIVADMAPSIAFYRDLLGLKVTMSVSADKDYSPDGLVDDAVFAALNWDGAELMLQTRDSLAAENPEFAAPPSGGPMGIVFIRGYDPASVAERVPAEFHVRGPETTWYGMNELTLRDPDGHIVTLALPTGEGQ
jgi:catechol 2,3-dioxygenase-like lactoylglutathione lyase family enzyme